MTSKLPLLYEIDCDVMDALDPCQVNPPCGGWLVG